MFRWENFSKGNLKELARVAGLRVTYAAEDLAEKFGTPPTTDFIDATWAVLRDRWLDGSPASRKAVVGELRQRGVGSRSVKVSTKPGQMEYLRSCRLSPNLREVVLDEFIAVGSIDVVRTIMVSPDDDADTSAAAADEGPESEATDDIGLTVINTLYRDLMIDDEWAVFRPRGFTWWSHRLAQHVDAAEPTVSDDGAIGSVITIRTEVVRDVPERSHPVAAAQVNDHNRLGLLSALVWDEESASVDSFITVKVHADTVPLWVPLLMVAALMQNQTAHGMAMTLAEDMKGIPSYSEHPQGGERPEADELMGAPASWRFGPGAGTSAFSGELMRELLSFAEQWSFANGEDDGFTGEVPFSGTRTSIEAAMKGEGPIETAIVRINTAEPHPTLGSGVWLFMQLPLPVDAEQALIIANAFNLFEGAGHAPCKLLGSWCAFDDAVVFMSFVPSLVARPGILPNLYLDCAVRAWWANDMLTVDEDEE